MEEQVRGDGCQPGGCPHKCFDGLNEEQREYVFDNFRGLSSYDQQNAYIVNCVKIVDVKWRCATKEGDGHVPKKKRTHSTDGDSEDSDGTGTQKLLHIRVCKHTFLDTLAISGKRVDNLAEKVLKNPLQIPDQHGKSS